MSPTAYTLLFPLHSIHIASEKMSQYASMKLPAGGDQNKGPALQAVNLVSFCFAAIVVIARMCYRTLKIKQTAWDDYMILLSTVSRANHSFLHTNSCRWVQR